ncbi:hypothetical protein SAY87_008121 [Trapa incisa]|uniref:GBF-interacting protein 1 N-terminal domain-containing protein n=1 Tax=Trapa incisa TaxID=236973 RepID=A0AAN7KFI6_9MYRT|nr:hypothetical protein SAY87_008121 [Trapa incisa]
MWSSSEEKKMVRRLKDILHDRPEHEICAMLQECNMDPDEAVQRLLSQDTFQEVKSKREKRKEMREIQDLKPRIGGGARNGGWSCDRDEGETIVQSDSIACGTSMYKGETVSVISSQHPPCPSAAETANLQLHDRDYLDSVTKGHRGGICNKENSFTRQPVKSKPSGPIAGTRRPSVIDTITRSSLCNGSSGFADTEMSPNCEGGGQGSSGYLSTVATNGSGVTHHSMSPLKHFSSNGESTNKTSPLEGKTLADQTSVDAGAVVLPSHLQALAADCSHLSFGTYKPRSSSTTTGLPLPNSSSNDSKMSTTAGNRPSTKECFLTETHEPPSTQLTRQQILGAASGSGQMLAVSDLVSQGSQNKTPNIIHEHAYASSHMKEEVHQYSTEMLISYLLYPRFYVHPL